MKENLGAPDSNVANKICLILLENRCLYLVVDGVKVESIQPCSTYILTSVHIEGCCCMSSIAPNACKQPSPVVRAVGKEC